MSQYCLEEISVPLGLMDLLIRMSLDEHACKLQLQAHNDETVILVVNLI